MSIEEEGNMGADKALVVSSKEIVVYRGKWYSMPLLRGTAEKLGNADDQYYTDRLNQVFQLESV